MPRNDDVYVIEIAPGRYNAYRADETGDYEAFRSGMTRQELCDLLCREAKGRPMAVIPNTQTGPPGNPVGEPPPFLIRTFLRDLQVAQRRLFSTPNGFKEGPLGTWGHAIRTRPLPDLMRFAVTSLFRR